MRCWLEAGSKTRSSEITRKYPAVSAVSNLRDQLENMVARTRVTLPRSVFERAQTAIKELHEFAHSPQWLGELRNRLISRRQIEVFETAAPESSVLTSFDFHYDFKTDLLSLIEINTNASMFLLTAEISEGEPGTRALESLHDSFVHEWGENIPGRVAIIDDTPPAQRAYFEFLMFADLFRSWGVQTVDIYDTADLPVEEILQQHGFIYNRSTDFYLELQKSAQLWTAWHENQLKMSPHPREYLLLADKQRLIDFSEKQISPVLIPARHISSYTDPDKLWEQRKNLFFKPRALFGGKAVYRGASISTKVFREIMTKDYIVQEYRPAGEWMEQKFDLRFFVYKSDIQLVCARIYTGQVTNFSNPGGGIAAIQFY